MTTERPPVRSPATLPATTVVQSAAELGLTPEEICETVVATLDRLPGDAKVHCINELTGALAKRLLEKERQLSGRR
jgi:hypothetical protein